MQSDTALPRCPLTSRGNRHPGADNSNPSCCPTPSPAPQQLQPRQQGACFPSGSHKSHLSSCASGSLPGTAWEQHPNFLLATPFPVRHVCSLPAQGILISPGSNLTREKGQCLGICLHVPERRNLLLTPSYSIHSHSTASPRIPLVMHGVTGAAPVSRMPWKHPADTGAHSGARGRQGGVENDPAGESEPSTLPSAPSSSPSITRSTQRETSTAR